MKDKTDQILVNSIATKGSGFDSEPQPMVF